MLRLLSAASLALLLVVQTFGQGLGQAPAQTAKPVTLRQVWTLDTTYTDHQHGVTFRYPSAWQAATQFGYHPPALTLSATKPIAGFGYSEGGFPRDPGSLAHTRARIWKVSALFILLFRPRAQPNARPRLPRCPTRPSVRRLCWDNVPFPYTKLFQEVCRNPCPEISTQLTRAPFAIYSRRMWPWFRRAWWMISRRSRRHKAPRY